MAFFPHPLGAHLPVTGPAPSGNIPATAGLMYDPSFEHDACGFAFVADLNGRRSHDVVAKGVSALIRLDHRAPGVPRRIPETAPGS